MIPLGDADRRPLHLPVVTALIIGVNVLLFLLELIDGDAFISRWSLVPADIMAHIGGFVFGMALGRLFEGRRLRAQQGLE
jgi:membrane associated rhomboid family serine protease